MTALARTVGAAQFVVLRALLRGVTRTVARVADLGGLAVPYLERPGRGQPIVLVHGFGGDKETWLMLVARLDPTRRLIIPDVPGFGACAPIDGAQARISAQAARMVQLLDATGIDRAHFVGNSMGGGISLRAAADYPDRVRTIGLLCSTGPIVYRSDFQLARDRGENLLVPRTVAESERMLSMVMERPPPVPRPLQRYMAALRVRDARRLDAMFTGFTADGELGDIPALEGIATPALVIHGAQDRVIHPATGRALAAGLANAELKLLTGIGHIPQVEHPRLTARLLDAFHARYDAA